MSDDDGVINITRPPKPRGRPFVKGQSGNQAGKPKGIESTPDRLRRMIREHIPAIIETLTQSALAGDSQAARLLMERALPPIKAGYPTVNIQPAGDSLTEQGAAVLRAMTTGVIPPDAGNVLLQGLTAQARLIESIELSQRIERLEATLKEQQS